MRRRPWALCHYASEPRAPGVRPGDAAACTVLDDVVVLVVSDAVSGTRGERLALLLVEAALNAAAETGDPLAALETAAEVGRSAAEGEATLEVIVASRYSIMAAIAGDGPSGARRCNEGSVVRIDPAWDWPHSYISHSRGLVGEPYLARLTIAPPYTIAVATDGIPWRLLEEVLADACRRPPLIVARRAVLSPASRTWDDRGLAIARVEG